MVTRRSVIVSGICGLVAEIFTGIGAIAQESEKNEGPFLKLSYPKKLSYKDAWKEFQDTLSFAIQEGAYLMADVKRSLKLLSEKKISDDELKQGENEYQIGLERSEKDPQGGIDYLLKFIRKHPTNPEPWMGVGDIYHNLKEHYKQEVFYYSAYLTLSPDSQHSTIMKKRVEDSRDIFIERSINRK